MYLIKIDLVIIASIQTNRIIEIIASSLDTCFLSLIDHPLLLQSVISIVISITLIPDQNIDEDTIVKWIEEEKTASQESRTLDSK